MSKDYFKYSKKDKARRVAPGFRDYLRFASCRAISTSVVVIKLPSQPPCDSSITLHPSVTRAAAAIVLPVDKVAVKATCQYPLVPSPPRSGLSASRLATETTSAFPIALLLFVIKRSWYSKMAISCHCGLANFQALSQTA